MKKTILVLVFLLNLRLITFLVRGCRGFSKAVPYEAHDLINEKKQKPTNWKWRMKRVVPQPMCEQ